MEPDQFDILRNYFTSEVDTENESGWEEQTVAALQYLLKNSLGVGQSNLSQTTKMQ